MAKFNNTVTTKTENKSGHVAYSMAPKSKLITQVLTSFFNEQRFYGDNSAEITDTIKEVIKQDPQFVSNLAVYARRVFNMRSIAHVLTGHLANVPEGKPYIKKTVQGVTLRGDDLTEILSFYLATFGKPIPNGLRRAMRDVFTAFDAYTLAKYKGEGHAVKMRDILRICRPVPKDEAQSEMWKQLLDGTLPAPYTWETELSAKGNNKETWEGLIASGKLPYMAGLRNVRNIVSARPDNLDTFLSFLSNPDAVRKSKQLPFRFLSAYRENEGAGTKVLDALEAAADASVANLPRISGRTVIAIDTSGSMGSRISTNSDIRCCDIAAMLGIIASKICEDAVVYKFDTKLYTASISSRTGILYAALHESSYGGGTNMDLPFEQMIKDNVVCDRIIILSDNECNRGYSWYTHKTIQSLADNYRRASGCDIWVHAVDLQGYGTQQFSGPKTNIIAGWSEKVFNFILLAEQGEGTLEKTIGEYTW